MTRILHAQLLAQHPAPGRECGSCTACCSVLAIVELQKPPRRACDHLCRSGCGIYAARPASCREFHCLWLRGAIDGDEALRPDQLGVMFDYFIIAGSGETHLIAFELWAGAFDDPTVRLLLREVCQTQALRLSYRDGRWSTLEAGAAGDTAATGE